MKVWEKINELKGTNATLQEIKTWSYMNRVCPLMLEDGLELEQDFPPELDALIDVACDTYPNCNACYDGFFSQELEKEWKNGHNQGVLG